MLHIFKALWWVSTIFYGVWLIGYPLYKYFKKERVNDNATYMLVLLCSSFASLLFAILVSNCR